MENANPIDLKTLREMLPHGANKAIAEVTKYARTYVSAVLNGKEEITSTNIAILVEAKKIAEKAKRKMDSTTEDLNKFLSENKA